MPVPRPATPPSPSPVREPAFAPSPELATRAQRLEETQVEIDRKHMEEVERLREIQNRD